MVSKMPKVNILNLFWIAIGFIAAYLVHIITRAVLKEAFNAITLLCLCGFLFYFAYRHKKNETIVYKILAGVILFFTIFIFYSLALTYLTIPEFDFFCFYLFGKIGSAHSNFYNPQLFLQEFNNLNLQARTSKHFIEEIVNVGFWYPPPSMFLFLILGLFDLQTGYFIWQTLVITFLLIDILLLTKFYLFQAGLNYKQSHVLVVPFILILLYPNILGSIYYSQIITLFLLLLLLQLFYLNSWKAGIFVPILVIIKPLAVFFIFYFIFFKKWKAVLAAAITGFIILVITALFFGTQNFINYFTSPPTDRIPDYIYYESSALFGVIKRLQRDNPAYISISRIKVVYYLLSTALVALTFIFLSRLYKISNMLAFLIFIPLALLIYPGAYFNYNILSIPVILYIFTQRLFKEQALNLLLIVLLYLIDMYSAFLFNLALWIILINWSSVVKYLKKNSYTQLVST
jgi:hypothetical protein